MQAESWLRRNGIIPLLREKHSLSFLLFKPGSYTYSNISTSLRTIRQWYIFARSLILANARRGGLNFSRSSIFLSGTYLERRTQLILFLGNLSHEARWAELLAEFNFSIRHIPGKENTADSLSGQSEPRLWAELGSLEFSLDLHPDEAKEIEDGYADDRDLSHIINRLRSVGDNDSFRDKYFWDEENKRLYLIDSSTARLCIPKGPIRLKILQENHDCISAGHPGRDRTFWNLSRHFYWPGMGRSVKDFVKTCDSCQRNKCARMRTGLLQSIPIPVRPWESISMDFIMGLPKTERQRDAIFTFVDRLTKYVHVIPTKSMIDAEGAARHYVNNVFAYHGLSKSIVSDRDPRFTTAFFKEVFSLLGVKLNMSTANHPQTDGMTERVNRIVEDTLRPFVNHCQTDWDELLALCQFSMNNSFSTSTEDTPFYLTSRQHPVIPSTLVDMLNIMWFRPFLAAWLASATRGSIAVSQGLSRLSSSSSGFLLWSGEERGTF